MRNAGESEGRYDGGSTEKMVTRYAGQECEKYVGFGSVRRMCGVAHVSLLGRRAPRTSTRCVWSPYAGELRSLSPTHHTQLSTRSPPHTQPITPPALHLHLTPPNAPREVTPRAKHAHPPLAPSLLTYPPTHLPTHLHNNKTTTTLRLQLTMS